LVITERTELSEHVMSLIVMALDVTTVSKCW